MTETAQTNRTVTLRFFAWMRERTGVSEADVIIPNTVRTVRDLVIWLKSHDERYARAFVEPRIVRAAIDKRHVEVDTEIGNAREIAFFPPMTGG